MMAVSFSDLMRFFQQNPQAPQDGIEGITVTAPKAAPQAPPRVPLAPIPQTAPKLDPRSLKQAQAGTDPGSYPQADPGSYPESPFFQGILGRNLNKPVFNHVVKPVGVAVDAGMKALSSLGGEGLNTIARGGNSVADAIGMDRPWPYDDQTRRAKSMSAAEEQVDLASKLAPGSVGEVGALGGLLENLNAARKASGGMGQAIDTAMGIAPQMARDRGTFAGVGAKTADMNALKVAEELEAAGKSADDIWAQTGWGRGADNKWRFEINDSTATLNNAVNEGDGLGVDGIISHQDVAAAYPKTDNLFFERQRGKVPRGSYQRAVVDGMDNDPISSSILIDAANPERARSIGLHEIQHNLQDLEGFGKGGSNVNAFSFSGPESAFAIYKQIRKNMKTPMPVDDYIKQAWGNERSPEAMADYESYVKSLKKPISREMDRAAQETAAREWYNRLSGEVEARNVQHRMDFTPEQRRATPPWATEDVPRNKQIIRLLGDGKAMSEGPLLHRGADLSQEAQIAATPKTSPKLLTHGVSGAEISGTKLPIPVNEMSAELETLPLLKQKLFDIQKAEGNLILMPGDRTNAGVILKSINEQKLDEPVRLYGGKKYMLDDASKIDNAVWASNQGIATRFSNLANKASEGGTKDVNAIYMPMGSGSMDSSHMPTQVMIEQLKTAKIGSKQLRKLDAIVRETIPNMPSLSDIDGLKNRLLKNGSKDELRNFIAALDSPAARELGAPDVASIRFALTDPDLVGTKTHQGGQVVAKFSGKAGTQSAPSIEHPSYDTQIIGGEYVGGIPGGVPSELLFPDAHAANLAGVSPKGVPYHPYRFPYINERKGIIQPITNELKDKISKFLERSGR